jgi:hypothetical protein
VYNYLKKLCTKDGKTNFGILVMPYYSMRGCSKTDTYILGNIESYVWREEELGVLKNVLKQICFSLMYAYEKLGFLHNGDHLGNILLYRTDKKSLVYGHLELPLEDLYAVITDFEKSTIGTTGDVFSSIRGLIHLVSTSEKSDMALDYEDAKLMRLRNSDTVIKKKDYITVTNVIDTMTIRYVKSKVAKMKLS